MNCDNTAINPRSPITVLTVVLVMTWGVLATFGWSSYRTYHNLQSSMKHDLRIEELRGNIIHLDEVLTMSARMAVFTENLQWEDRYRRFEPHLDTAIKEAMGLTAEVYSGDAAAKTDAANNKLVEMEKRAFDLMHQGRVDEAKAVLFNREYETQKQLYVEGMPRFAKTKERHLRLAELRNTIVHLDEVLTMSARLAAVTGDLQWKKRYRLSEPQLDATIKEAVKLAPEAQGGKAAAEIDTANIKLVKMENYAFDLVRQGRLDEAKAVLFSDEYESQKQIYTKGMDVLSAGLADAVSIALKRKQWLSFLQTGTMLLIMPLLVVGWLVVFRAVRNWKMALTKQAKELAEVNVSLDQRVIDRTRKLQSVTEKQTEMVQLLGEREARLQAIMESASEGIVTINERGIMESFNKAAVAMFGYRAEEVIGQNVSMLVPSPDSEQHDQYLANYLRTGHAKVVGIKREVEGKQKDGVLFPLELNVSEINMDGMHLFTAIIRDLTERKQTEGALRESHEYTNNIIGSMIATLIVVAPDGTIVTVNEATCSLLGYREKELIGQPARLLFSEEEEEEEEHLANMVVSRHALPVRGTMLRTLISVGHVNDVEGWYTAKDGSKIPVAFSGSVMRDSDGEIQGIVCVAQDITERKEHEESLRLQGAALESAANAIVIADQDGRISWTNHAFSQMTGYSREEAVGSETSLLKSGQHDVVFYTDLWQTVLAGKVWHGEIINRRKDGSLFTDESTITPVADDRGKITHFIAVKQDITDRKIAEANQKQLQCELTHAQKLESVGQLAAGIAHEINTPTQYVGDNTRFLEEAFSDISTVLDKFEELLQAVKEGSVDEKLVEEVEATLKQADIEYLTKEVPQAINQSLDGVERVATIVRAMKEFSHPGSEEKKLVNLAEAIETTITVARNEWKYVAEVETQFDFEMPEISCLPGELNQVFLNLIVNAAHAIGDTLGEDREEKGTITVGTRRDGAWAEIFIRDTGTGIPENVQAKIFDPFFTTKEVGKGTGQGLAIARSVVVDKHGGTIDCQTKQGKGTTFIVRLPVDEKQQI